MIEMVEVKEDEFIMEDDARMRDLSDCIKRSGLSVYQIANGCRIAWKTVKKAVNCCPVHSSTESRIRLFIERNKNGNS